MRPAPNTCTTQTAAREPPACPPAARTVEHLVRVRGERVKRLAQVARVPQLDGLVHGGREQQELLERVERQAHDVLLVRGRRRGRDARLGLAAVAAAVAHVPQRHQPVVAARRKQVRAVPVPRDVLHDVRVPRELARRLQRLGACSSTRGGGVEGREGGEVRGCERRRIADSGARSLPASQQHTPPAGAGSWQRVVTHPSRRRRWSCCWTRRPRRTTPRRRGPPTRRPTCTPACRRPRTAGGPCPRWTRRARSPRRCGP